MQISLNKEKLRKIFGGVVLALSTFMFMFLFLEIALRVLRIESDNLIMQDPVLGWTHLPGKKGYSRSKEFSVKVKINKDGFIGPDYDYTKPIETTRILVLGDSLTEAFQVPEEDSYVRLLENNLKNYFRDRTFEVLNMGIAGYGTEREYYVLKNKGLKFKPDMVLLGFFVGNDFSDNMAEQINPNASFSKYVDSKNKIKLFVRNHSVAWRFILHQKSKNKILAYFKNRNKVQSANPIKSSVDLIEIKHELDQTERVVNNLKKLTDDNDIKLVIAILPSAGQLYSDQHKEENILSNGLISFLKKEKISYVDLLPNFKLWANLNKDKLLYLPLDGHPNKYGQLMISEGISKYLTNFFKENGNF